MPATIEVQYSEGEVPLDYSPGQRELRLPLPDAKFYTDSRQVSEVALTERLWCGVEVDAGRTGAYYSLLTFWIMGKGRSLNPKSKQWRACRQTR